MSDIVKAESVGLATITIEKARAFRDSIAYGCSDGELLYFVEAANRLGLDPLSKQIYAIKRGGRMTLQTSIDGYRSIAERTGQYEGPTEPQWCGEDGEWKTVWLSKSPPSAARIGVHRRGFREPCYGVARFDAYDGKNDMWRKMPDVMLAKCAEAQALRKAFPATFNGIYTREEMDQAERREEWKNDFDVIDAETGEVRTAKEQNDEVKRAQDEALAGLKQSLTEQLQACSSTRGLERIIWDAIPLIRDYPKANFYQQAQSWMMIKGERLGMTKSEVQQLIFTAFEQSAGATEEGEAA